VSQFSGNIIKCTLWEDFATQFANFNKQRTDWGPTIVLLHNCKIKDATGFMFCYHFSTFPFQIIFILMFKMHTSIHTSCHFADLYELCVSNVWNGTELFINADLPEITAFKEGLTLSIYFLFFFFCFNYLLYRLGVEECSASQSQQLSSQSQMLSQSTQLTQYTPTDKFLANALILPLKDVLNLPEVVC
jgi:hypothetical protein